MAKIVIEPVTRIEGHLKIEVVIEGGKVKEARSAGTMFRGFELIMQGRDPRDAPLLTQRICGVCPVAHATASSFCLDDAFGIKDKITPNGRIIRNLILGSNFLQSHVLHFYHLAALDFVDVARAAAKNSDDPGLQSLKDFAGRGKLDPFIPRYEGDYRLPDEVNAGAAKHYLEALEVRRKAHELLAIFGGKMPHQCGIVPGGTTQVPTVDKMTAFLWRLNEIRQFINNKYLPDVVAVAQSYPDHLEIGGGCGNFLSYGVFDLAGSQGKERLFPAGLTSVSLQQEPFDLSKITEDVKHSKFSSRTSGKHPVEGETVPEADKEGAYSWLKAPRYDGKVCEVGPLARMVVGYAAGNKLVKENVDGLLGTLKASPKALFSALGRHAARALECKLVADAMADWILELKPGEPVYTEYEMPEEASGAGLTDAPRGALGHWIRIKEKKVASYQCVVPTTWNAGPADDKGVPGPIEQALIGATVKDEKNPFEIVRIIRSFDPCLACAVHALTPKGKDLARLEVVA